MVSDVHVDVLVSELLICQRSLCQSTVHGGVDGFDAMVEPRPETLARFVCISSECALPTNRQLLDATFIGLWLQHLAAVSSTSTLHWGSSESSSSSNESLVFGRCWPVFGLAAPAPTGSGYDRSADSKEMAMIRGKTNVLQSKLWKKFSLTHVSRSHREWLVVKGEFGTWHSKAIQWRWSFPLKTWT